MPMQDPLFIAQQTLVPLRLCKGRLNASSSTGIEVKDTPDKCPVDVYYTAHLLGIIINWNGRPHFINPRDVPRLLCHGCCDVIFNSIILPSALPVLDDFPLLQSTSIPSQCEYINITKGHSTDDYGKWFMADQWTGYKGCLAGEEVGNCLQAVLV